LFIGINNAWHGYFKSSPHGNQPPGFYRIIIEIMVHLISLMIVFYNLVNQYYSGTRGLDLYPRKLAGTHYE